MANTTTERRHAILPPKMGRREICQGRDAPRKRFCHYSRTMGGWFFFDWFIIILVLVAIALNASYFRVDTHSVKFAYIRVMTVLVILVWLRILKYLRPFPGIGTLVLILGATIGDFVNWGFFYLLLFVPFTSCFWIIFGGRAPIAVPSYSKAQRIVYTAIQMSLGEGFDLDGETLHFYL